MDMCVFRLTGRTKKMEAHFVKIIMHVYFDVKFDEIFIMTMFANF